MGVMALFIYLIYLFCQSTLKSTSKMNDMREYQSTNMEKGKLLEQVEDSQMKLIKTDMKNNTEISVESLEAS